MSEKEDTGNAPGGEGSDESHNAPMDPPVPSDASVSESADDDRLQQDDGNYVVIFTPKVIISDSEVQPLPGETLNFFYRRHEIQQSRAHILDRVKGELKISSSVWESQIISATASHSHVLPPGNRSRVIMSHTQSQTIQLEIFRSRSHKLRFQTDQACQVLSSAVTRRHIAPEKRVQMVERLLKIRDLFVDVVVCLRSVGFGGKDFTWSPTDLEAYGVTQVPPLRIPEAFKAFASPSQLSS